MRDHFIQRLMELAAADSRLMLVTGDLGFGVLTKFQERFPRQYLNVGVAEQNLTGVATGLALEGRTVFTYSIGNFPTLRCLEQVRNDAAYHDANVKVVAIGGGFSYGQLGMSHHATEDLSILRALPGVEVASPGCLWETVELTSAIANRPGVCYLRLDKSDAGDTQLPGERFEFGKARRLREGEDLAIFATGGILEIALEAASELAAERVAVRIVSFPTLKPLDTNEIRSACEGTGGIITIEENVLNGGFGSAIAEACMDGGFHPKAFRRLGMKDVYSSVVGSQAYLRNHYGLGKDHLVAAVKELVLRPQAATSR
ncbi:MAG: 1-deoxy-D-xylulose-5-phosphate synthase [Fimbriimonadaceae bacterium]|nr:1-deoxy-D-xylulose-5-phosphate synthase [Fimbriimonadaceae bacterium]